MPQISGPLLAPTGAGLRSFPSSGPRERRGGGDQAGSAQGDPELWRRGNGERAQVVAAPRRPDAQLLDAAFLAQWSEGCLMTT